MIRLSWRAAGCAATALVTLLTSGTSQAAPYYVSWSQLYDDTDSTRSQTPTATAVDSKGNVFVTGSETVGNGTGLYVAKYDALDGHLLWQRRINSGTTIFQMNAIAVDSLGDCVVTGSRNAGGIDYYTIKLKGGDGTNYWADGPKIFAGGVSGNMGEDTALKVVCDNANDVIVTGRSAGKNGMGNSTAFDWVTIKYDKDDAVAELEDKYTQSTSTLNDVPAGLAVDSSNNIYVVGTVQTGVDFRHFYLRKLSGSTLGKLWDISPIDTGLGGVDAEGGATAVTVDQNNNVIATGMARDSSNRFGYFTVKYNSSGTKQWQSIAGPFSQFSNGTPYAGSGKNSSRPQPVGISVGLDNAPIVTGSLLNSDGDPMIRTVKYTSGGFMMGADDFWDAPSIDNGLGFGDTLARAIVADDAGNAIVVGETENADGDTDLYVVKYDTLTGERVYFNSFTRSTTNPSQDKGVDVAVDRLGNITALGTFVASKNGSPTAGNNEFGTIKLNRFIAPTSDDLPNFIPGVADEAKVTVAGTPAISAAGTLAAKVTFKAGKKVGHALLVERTAAGGTLLPAVQGQPAPVAAGDPAANWISFSDPIVAPNGTYAFAAKVSGLAAKANGVWANLNGTLKLVLRQGSVIPVAASTDKFASLVNMGVSSNNLIALVKLAGPAATNTALLRVDQNNAGTMLLRAGQALTIGPDACTVKTITIFSPAPSEAGDGRWQGANGVIVRVLATKNSDPKAKVTALVSILNAGSPVVRFYTAQDAPAPANTTDFASFGLPSTAFGSSRYVFKAKLTPQTATTDDALVYSFDGMPAQSTTFAQEGSTTGVAGLGAITYGGFSDPIVNSNSATAYIATLKGTLQEVRPTSNKAIIVRTATGNTSGTFASVARTGDAAKDSAGNDSLRNWTAFTSLVLPGGSKAGPIFIAKTNAPKNKLGIWAQDSTGKVRLLLNQGDNLGGQLVRSFRLLNTVPKGMATARSFDSGGSVAVALTFTNNKTAIVRIGIP